MSAEIQPVGVVTDVQGLTLTPADRELLLRPELSGVIFFARNYESPQQLIELTASIRELRPDLLLSADQEGGRVQRFREGFSRFAPMLTLEARYREDESEACELAFLGGCLLATELIQHGVDLTFAPVLDVEKDCSRVIGDRAFAHDPDAVTALAGAWARGLNAAGMKAVGKHFPGHGGVVGDSHHELPTDYRPMSELAADIAPFAALIGAGLMAGIMPAHVIYPALDAQHTAGFSPLWLRRTLRSALGFDGVIFSDDLSMAGAASGGDFYERSLTAAAAGANALVVCNNPDASWEVVRAVQDLRQQGYPSLSLESWKPDCRLPADSETEQARTRLRDAGLIL
tara:strand:+ start:58525 stop:59553 length:1029 start_codon:yes stop_codon:yes gene_type:complete